MGFNQRRMAREQAAAQRAEEEQRQRELGRDPVQAQKLVAKKGERQYTAAKHDIQEKNLRHLEDAAEMYDMMSRSRPWATIQCFDAGNNKLRLPEDIARECLQAVKPVLDAWKK